MPKKNNFQENKSTKKDQRYNHRYAVYRGVKEENRYNRVCLCCGKNFIAFGKFNRICDECKRQTEFKSYE